MFQGAPDDGGAAPFTEATLNRREQFIFLQVPDQSVIEMSERVWKSTVCSAEHTAAVTTSCVTGWKLGRTQLTDVKLGDALLEVDLRISETFLSKKLWKSPVLMSSLPCGWPRPSCPLINCHICLDSGCSWLVILAPRASITEPNYSQYNRAQS